MDSEVTAGDLPKIVPIFAWLSGNVKHSLDVVGLVGMEYRCEVPSLTGLIQLLACNYLPHGYWFYVTGHVPPGKNPHDLDDKLLKKYGISRSRSSRARRKAKGEGPGERSLRLARIVLRPALDAWPPQVL